MESDQYYHSAETYDTAKVRLQKQQYQRKCSCVNCQEDELCGGLWNGTQDLTTVRNISISQKEIHIVVSHCSEDLNFIETLTNGFHIASIHIISKCSQHVKGAPENAKLKLLPNVGRYDHSYAYYITSVLPAKIEETKPRNNDVEDIIVVFLNDNVSEKNHHQPGQWVSFENMIRLASSKNGFACGILPGASKFQPNYQMSAYYDLESLKRFSKREYASRNLYDKDGVNFQSAYPNIRSFYGSLNAGPITTDVVPVCYGGIFATSVKHIQQKDIAVWKAVEKKLTRGDSIEESHFMERLWALLLSRPLEPYQAEALRNASNYIYQLNGMLPMYTGALVRRSTPFWSQLSSTSGSSSDSED
jgi:hypothetical protein